MHANERSFWNAWAKGIFVMATSLGLLRAAGTTSAEESPNYRDLFPDTWVAQDALGRNMPSYSVVGARICHWWTKTIH